MVLDISSAVLMYPVRIKHFMEQAARKLVISLMILTISEDKHRHSISMLQVSVIVFCVGGSKGATVLVGIELW